MTQRAVAMIHPRAHLTRARTISHRETTRATIRETTLATMDRATQAHATATIPRVNPTVTRPSFEDFLKRLFLASLAVV